MKKEGKQTKTWTHLRLATKAKMQENKKNELTWQQKVKGNMKVFYKYATGKIL